MVYGNQSRTRGSPVGQDEAIAGWTKSSPERGDQYLRMFISSHPIWKAATPATGGDALRQDQLIPLAAAFRTGLFR